LNHKGLRKLKLPSGARKVNPLVIYSKPFSLGEKRGLFKNAKNDDLGVLVDVIVLKARDAKMEIRYLS
jgi:hypothetical protein